MKNESFYEILIKKIQENESVSSNSHTSSSSLNIGDPLKPNTFRQKIDSEVLWNKFFKETLMTPFTASGPSSASNKYPKSNVPPRPKIATVEATPSPKRQIVAEKIEIERWVLKSSLTEDGIAKWNLFEKTLSVNFGEKINPKQARSAYRQFLKKNHPDQTGEKTTRNFSTLVKIKDELIKALEESLGSGR